ncbi:MAG: hypothetical protein JNM70_11465 [Anaerolineae bacterium]|nr:hypothetical protein [Anaerolineae bacterium]
MKSGFVLILVLLLAACSSQSEADLPTLIPTPGGVEAAVTATTLPPTEPAPTQASIVRPTLPPTWTPAVMPTEPDVQATMTPVVLPTGIPLATLEACGTFLVDLERSTSTFKLGESPVVYWSPAANALRYRVSVIDEFGQELFMDYAIDATYAFPADLFKAGKRYGWVVYPEDNIGRQMCFQQGGELFISP